MGSQLTWEPGQYTGARPTILQNQDFARVSCHSVSSTAPCSSMILLISRYVVLAMTETNTVWYVKTQGCSYLCKQNRERRKFRVWGEDSWNIKWKLVDFQYRRRQQLRTDAGYTSTATRLLENIWEGERDGAPEGQHRRDWHRHRQNVSQHLKQSDSDMRFRIHKHVSVLLFMRKLAFTRTWRSQQLTFLRAHPPCMQGAASFWVIPMQSCCWQLKCAVGATKLVVYNHVFTEIGSPKRAISAVEYPVCCSPIMLLI